MKLISRLRGRCFCAFCKAERKVYVKKHVDLTNVVGAILLSTIVGQAYWGAPDPRALVLFCMTILLSEVFVYLRWRQSVICSLCGFDPVVYKRSPERAAKLVRDFYRERQENPDFYLTRSPLLERKRRELARERKLAEYKALETKKRGSETASLVPKDKLPLATPKSP